MRLIPRSRRGMLWRFALGAVIVIAFTATTTAVAGLLQFKQFAADLSVTPAIKHAPVTVADPGQPADAPADRLRPPRRRAVQRRQHRHDDARPPRPELLDDQRAVDPARPEVQIPEGGGDDHRQAQRRLLDRRAQPADQDAQAAVFPGLQVNHIIDVNFGGFADLVNAIGCVYTDVDHRYYNNTALTDYSSIDIQPGYQKLCGTDALAFVRFRHTDTDIVRNARQQDFLRWAKDQFSSSELFNNRDKLLQDLRPAHPDRPQPAHDRRADQPVRPGRVLRRAHDQADHVPGDLPAVQLRRAGRGRGGACGRDAVLRHRQSGGRGQGVPRLHDTDPSVERRLSPPRAQGTTRAAAPTANLTAGHDRRGDAGPGGPAQANLPVYYPRLIVAGSQYCTNATTARVGPDRRLLPARLPDPRPAGHPHTAYRMTLVINPVLGQYYGVQGTTWQNPPILDSPPRRRRSTASSCCCTSTAHELTLVAWRTPKGVYWISNTLTDTLSNAQMLAIAASLTRARRSPTSRISVQRRAHRYPRPLDERPAANRSP